MKLTLQFEFHGLSAHVALPKAHCRNALDALVMSYYFRTGLTYFKNRSGL